MLFRAVIYSIDHSIDIVWVKDRGNWFNFNGRSYRKDRNAVCQVMEKDGHVNNKVEAIYIEGNPLPLRSKLDHVKVLDEHVDLVSAMESAEVKKGFSLFRR